MCNALSPEKAVIWTVLHDLAPTDTLSAAHFMHPAYRVWFEIAVALRGAGGVVNEQQVVEAAHGLGRAPRPADQRALRRLLRVAPPARIRNNAALLAQALVDRHQGRRVHIEKLIN